MPLIRSGDLRERVTIQRKSVTRNSFGEEVESWSPIAGGPSLWPAGATLNPLLQSARAAVWAKVEPLAGRERLMAQQMGSTADVRVTIRYRSDVAVTDRLVWRGKPLDITSVADVGARRQWLELMCVAGVRDGR